jgi:DNA-binding transcriptional ArsR family regulator
MDAALKALADPRRRAIVALVWDEELPATAIAAHFPDVSRPAISQHLGVLKHGGLLIEHRVGTSRRYRADHGAVADIRNYFDSFWTSRLERLRNLTEASNQPEQS